MKKIITVYCINIFCLLSMGNAAAKLDKAGVKITDIFQRVGYWILLVWCMKDLIAAGMRKDKRALGETIMFYALLYGALFFVPWVFDFIKSIFK